MRDEDLFLSSESKLFTLQPPERPIRAYVRRLDWKKTKPTTGDAQMLKIEFSEADVKALHYERYYHPHPRVQRKMEAVYLKSQGLRHPQICRLTGISGNGRGVSQAPRGQAAQGRDDSG